MKVKLDKTLQDAKEQKYDTLLLPIEWRYSASLVGLMRFFEFIEDREYIKLYKKTEKNDRGLYPIYDEIGGYTEGILYNSSDLTEERYLSFCEYYFGDDMPHMRAERLIKDIIIDIKCNNENEKVKLDECIAKYVDEEKKNQINNLLSGTGSNTVLKNIFKKTKFDGENANEILKIINENRMKIVRETFRNKLNMYRNFSNTNKLFSDSNPHCRLLGYDLDENRKSKSAAYKFDSKTFLSHDEIEFDFIPFAFTKSTTAFFVNNNCSITDLKKANDGIRDIMQKPNEIVNNKEVKDSAKTKLIKGMIEIEDFYDYDIEIIQKKRDDEFFSTFFIRKNALQKIKEIYKNSNLRYIYKYSFNYYLNVEDELIECCVNNVDLDGLLERLLIISKEDANSYVSAIIIPRLVRINAGWKDERFNELRKRRSGTVKIALKEGSKMSKLTKRAKVEGENIGKTIAKKSGENKVKSYKNRLINTILAHDYDRVLEIMLQMSGYIEKEISTIYDLIDNKYEWSDIAISFTNALTSYKDSNNKDDNEKNTVQADNTDSGEEN